MSRVPMFSNIGDANNVGSSLLQRYPDGLIPQEVSAELISDRWGISREELDAFVVRSHQLAAAACVAGAFAGEVVGGQSRHALVTQDETVRAGTTGAALSMLRPAFADPRWELHFGPVDWKITPAIPRLSATGRRRCSS